MLAAEKMIAEGRYTELLQEITGVTAEMLTNPIFVPTVPVKVKKRSNSVSALMIDVSTLHQEPILSAESVDKAARMKLTHTFNQTVSDKSGESSVNVEDRKQLYSPEMV